MKALAVAASRAPTLNAGTSLVSASTAQNVQTLPSCGSSPTRTLRSFLPTKPQISSISRRLQDRLRILAFINPMQPCPTFTPRRMIVSRWTPVMRSIARILEPSVSAAMTAICLSVLRVFAMPVNVIQNSLDVNDFCATLFIDMKYFMLMAMLAIVLPVNGQKEGRESNGNQNNTDNLAKLSFSTIKDEETQGEKYGADDDPKSYLLRLSDPANVISI